MKFITDGNLQCRLDKISQPLLDGKSRSGKYKFAKSRDWK